MSGAKSLYTMKSSKGVLQQPDPQAKIFMENCVNPVFGKLKETITNIIPQIDMYQDQVTSDADGFFRRHSQIRAEHDEEELKNAIENFKKQIGEEKLRRRDLEKEFQQQKQAIENKEQKLQQAEQSLAKTMADVENKTEQNDKILRQGQQKCEQLEVELREAENAKLRFKQQSEQLEIQLKQNEDNLQRYKQQCEHLEKQLKDAKATNVDTISSVDMLQRYQQRCEHLEKQLKDAKATNVDTISSIDMVQQYQQRCEHLEKQLKEAEDKTIDTPSSSNFDQLRRLQKQCEQMEKQLKEAENAKNDALSRLSKQMGNQLSEGNPNIADLSDADRPTKLGEKFAELYDNEWTNALETLTDILHKDEKDAIEMLYRIVTEAYSFCEKKLQEQFSLLERDLLHGGYTSVSVTDNKLSAGVRKILKDVRKMTSREAYANLLKAFRTNIDGSTIYVRNDIQNVEAYVEASFKLCYQMCLHDPPVALGSKPRHQDIFDGNTYKEYTISGKKIDFAVWPALFLHKGGSLLCKGVVQPIRSEGINKKYTHSTGQDGHFQSHTTGKVASTNFNGSSISHQVNKNTISHEKSYTSRTKDKAQTKSCESTKRIKCQHTFQISDGELDHFYHMYKVLGRRSCAQLYGYKYDKFVDALNARDERTMEELEILMKEEAQRAEKAQRAHQEEVQRAEEALRAQQEEDARRQEKARRQKEVNRRVEVQRRLEAQRWEEAQRRVEAQQRTEAQWLKEAQRAARREAARREEEIRRREEARQKAKALLESRPKWR